MVLDPKPKNYKVYQLLDFMDTVVDIKYIQDIINTEDRQTDLPLDCVNLFGLNIIRLEFTR